MFPSCTMRAPANRRPRQWVSSAAFLALAFAGIGAAHATTYFVRTDGGSAAQCTGTTDAAYPGSGSNQACAWNSLHQALPASGGARINGGDTVYVAPGEYMIGVDAPGANGGRCYSGGPWDCYLAPVPSGPSADRPTRILGRDPAHPAVLWGNERVSAMLNLNGSSNVEIGHLEITDKSECVEFHSTSSARCKRDNAPFGKWASSGITASNSRNVHLHDLNIHGLANRGIVAGGLTDWTVENVKIVANGWAGWDGDIGSGSSNSGNIVLREVEIAWNGCGEKLDGTPWACWAQTAGGYGDGLGTAKTGGHWLIEDSWIHHNTSDGLDLLYMDGGSNSSVTVRRTHAVGNAGNQLKTLGRATIENSVVVGNCAYFDGKDAMKSDDQCRALGNAISIGLTSGQPVVLRHNTITGQGDCLILSEGGSSSSSLSIQNNVLVGQVDWRGNATGNPGELACGHYAYNSSAALSYSGNAFWNVKSGQCPGGSVCNDPRLTRTALADFDATPLQDSPLLDKAPYLAAISNDFFKNPRPAGPAADIGAVERQSGGGTPAPSCSRSAPTLGLSGSTAAVAAGSTVSYTVTLSNRDSAECGSTTFNLARSIPSGWTGTLGKSSLTLAPGAAGTTTLNVVSAASASAGSHGIGVGTGSAVGSIHTRNASATYNVSAPTASCTRARPSFSLSGSPSAVPAGSTVRYTLNITNRDSSACGNTTFNLARSIPTGWSGSLSKNNASLAPGASTSATLDVSSPANASSGSHSIGAGASSNIGSVHTANGSASYTVEASTPPPAAGELEQSVSTDKSHYRRGETVRMTSLVVLGDQPATGASVSFVVTNPYGASETHTATANSAGRATATGTLSRWWWWAPPGTYTVRATATKGDISNMDETTFEVR